MDYFFRTRGATASIYKSGVLLQAMTHPLPGLARCWELLKVRTSSAVSTHLAMIGTDEVGNGSYFGGLTVVASLSHLTSTTGSKKLGVGTVNLG